MKRRIFLSIYYFGGKEPSNDVVSQAVRFLLYKNLTVKFISSQNAISYMYTWNTTNFNIVYNIMRFEAQKETI